MKNHAGIAIAGYWLLTGFLFAGALVMLFFYTPVESTAGSVQKIFYLHLPVAISTYAAALVVCIASAGFLWQRKMWWDDLAGAAGCVTVLFCSVVLLTGMIWGKSEWGTWWTWSPRLTFSLVLWLLYVVYVIVRSQIKPPMHRAAVSAVYGLVAFLDVPLVYLSVKLMPDIHPSSIALMPEMKQTLLVWVVFVVMLMGGIIMTRYKMNRRARELEKYDEQPTGTPFSTGEA